MDNFLLSKRQAYSTEFVAAETTILTQTLLLNVEEKKSLVDDVYQKHITCSQDNHLNKF